MSHVDKYEEKSMRSVSADEVLRDILFYSSKEVISDTVATLESALG